jgi:hypothetical protein
VPSIGGVTVDLMRGRPSGLRARVNTWEIAGLDGTGAIVQGRGNQGDVLELVRFGAASTVDSWFAAIEAINGTIVSVVDALGFTHTNILVYEVSGLAFSAAHLAAGVANAVRGQCSATVIKRS